MRKFHRCTLWRRSVVWRRHGGTVAEPTGPAAPTASAASIFERIPKPKVQAHSEESLELFSKLASPQDVPRQFHAAVQSGVQDVAAWRALSRTAVQSLRHFKVSHLGAILHSCAQMRWRDEHLLCGLTEAFRCACELRRGSVRDYSVILQALRRLNYCPWVGALRPILVDLRWRLRRQRWRPMDLVLALRFVAEFQVQHLPQVRAEGLALCRELQMRAEQRMGDMRHLELAHFARALVLLNHSGLPDTILLQRVADNFSRRADELPLGALLHMCSTLLTAKAEAPSEFRAVLVEKAQAELAYLKPFQIALLASTAAHFRLREPKLLVRLGQSVGSNLDTFNLQQVGMVAEAFAIVGHHHRSLVGYIEQILLKESKDFEGRSRQKLLATFLIAAAQQEHFAQRSQHLERFAEELTAALESYEVPMELSRPAALPKWTAALRRSPRWRSRAGGKASLIKAPTPPTPVTSKPGVDDDANPTRGRRSSQRRAAEETAIAMNDENATQGYQVPEVSARLDHLPSLSLTAQQLEDLEAIASTLGSEMDTLDSHRTTSVIPVEDSVTVASNPTLGGAMVPGVGFVSGRARRSFNQTALEVNGFAPSGSSVMRAHLPQRGATRSLHQIFGARHPANVRLLRRLKRLEQKMELHGATSMPFTETLRRKHQWYSAPAPRGKGPSKSRMDLNEEKAQLWRRLRRYRLGGFEPHLVQGNFEKLPGARPGKKVASSPVISLDQAVVLAQALQSSPQMPGRLILLQRLGEHCAKVAGHVPMKHLEEQRSFVAISKLSSILGSLQLPNPGLLRTLEAKLQSRSLQESLQMSSPRLLPRSFLSFLHLASAECGTGSKADMEAPCCHASTINSQLQVLLRGDGRVLLWTLPSDELADLMRSMASLVHDPKLLDPQLCRRLRRGLQAGLESLDLEMSGAALPKGWQRPLAKKTGGPPKAQELLELLAGLLWLECEADVKKACVHLGISAQKVADLAKLWRGKDSCQ